MRIWESKCTQCSHFNFKIIHNSLNLLEHADTIKTFGPFFRLKFGKSISLCLSSQSWHNEPTFSSHLADGLEMNFAPTSKLATPPLKYLTDLQNISPQNILGGNKIYLPQYISSNKTHHWKVFALSFTDAREMTSWWLSF